MKFSKKISIIVATAILVLCASNVAAYYQYFNNFTGPNHNSSGGSDCHNGTNANSTNAQVKIQCTSGVNVHAGDELSITVQVFSFTQAIGGDEETIVIGFPTALGDNSAFDIETAPISEVHVDSSGNTGVYTFSVDAPTTEGNYTLEAAAIDGHGGEGNHLDWTTGGLKLNVSGTVQQSPWDTPTGVISIVGIIAGFSAIVIVSIAIVIRNYARANRANNILKQGTPEDTRKKLGVRLKYAEDLPS